MNLTFLLFSEIAFTRERVFPRFFVTFNNFTSYIFPENLIEICLVVQRIWRFPSSILAAFANFLDFLTSTCYKKINDVSM